MSRRAILTSLGALCGTMLGGCGTGLRLDTTPTPTPPTLSPDDLARFRAIELLRLLAARAASVAPEDPLAALAGAAATTHAAQLEALGPLPGPVPVRSPVPSGWPSTGASPPAAATPGDALLAEEQRDALAVRGLAVGTADAELGGGTARLLASVAAACGALTGLGGATEPVTGRSPTPSTATGAEAPEDDPLGGAADALALLVERHAAARYAYGVLAVHLADDRRALALTQLEHHAIWGSALVVAGEGSGAQIAPAPPGFEVAAPADPAAAAALAADVELDVAAAATILVAEGTGSWRRRGADAVIRAAWDAGQWGSRPPLPGLPELA